MYMLFKYGYLDVTTIQQLLAAMDALMSGRNDLPLDNCTMADGTLHCQITAFNRALNPRTYLSLPSFCPRTW